MKLVFPNKRLRAAVIAEYIKSTTYVGCVCFSCGNASAALRATGVDTIDISPRGELTANRWWLPEEIQKAWPTRLDATSGHLSVDLMNRIGAEFREYFQHIDERIGLGPYDIPSGSGETLVCLKLAYPHTVFNAVYDSAEPSTAYSIHAPLNKLVTLLAANVVIKSANCAIPDPINLR